MNTYRVMVIDLIDGHVWEDHVDAEDAEEAVAIADLVHIRVLYGGEE